MGNLTKDIEPNEVKISEKKKFVHGICDHSTSCSSLTGCALLPGPIESLAITSGGHCEFRQPDVRLPEVASKRDFGIEVWVPQQLVTRGMLK